MEMETLRGFVSAAQELGYPIRDEEAFLCEQQARVFEWAASTDRIQTDPLPNIDRARQRRVTRPLRVRRQTESRWLSFC